MCCGWFDYEIVELNVWDVNRIFDVVNSKTQKESVEILLSDFGSEGIPCVKAVECVDVIADIEVSPKYDDIEDEEENSKPENLITYTSYLAVVPGQILNDLYLEYGSRLLEGNVRSFLSVRGKVNKSIQNTIKNYNDCDKFNSESDEYFLGPIVTFKNDDGKLEIIDGQQRLTTLMLLLRAFYDKYGSMKNDKAVKTSKFIEQCIWKTDEFGDPDKSALKIDSEVATDKDKKHYEYDTIGKSTLVLRWYAVILMQWIRGNGLSTIINSAIQYKKNHPDICYYRVK